MRTYAQDSLKYYNDCRLHIQKTGITVLGSWAIANLAIGTTASFNSTGSTKYFYQMDALWNIANLGAAIPGYINASKKTGKPLTAEETLKEQKKIETIFLVNGGLDLVYIAGGIYLNNRGNTTNSDKLRGYGTGMILQGAFLLLFDGTMYTTEKNNGNKLRAFLAKYPVTFSGNKIGMLINF
ncbi:MAG: DUF6992 family protein [Mucilaginibacter sp.]